MAILFTCQCGRKYKFHDEALGHKTRCTVCNALILISGPPGRTAPVSPDTGGEALGAGSGVSLDGTPEQLPLGESLAEEAGAAIYGQRPSLDEVARALKQLPDSAKLRPHAHSRASPRCARPADRLKPRSLSPLPKYYHLLCAGGAAALLLSGPTAWSECGFLSVIGFKSVGIFPNGYYTIGGLYAFILGLACAGLWVVSFAARRVTNVLAVLIALGGAAAAAVGILDFIWLMNAGANDPSPFARALAATIHPGIGVYLAIVGGLLLLVVNIIALVSRPGRS